MGSKPKTWDEKFNLWEDRCELRQAHARERSAYDAGIRHERSRRKEVEWEDPKTEAERDFWKETSDDWRKHFEQQKKINDVLGEINEKLQVERDTLKTEVESEKVNAEFWEDEANRFLAAGDKLRKKVADFHMEIGTLEYDMHLARNYIAAALEDAANRSPWWKFWGKK